MGGGGPGFRDYHYRFPRRAARATFLERTRDLVESDRPFHRDDDMPKDHLVDEPFEK